MNCSICDAYLLEIHEKPTGKCGACLVREKDAEINRLKKVVDSVDAFKKENAVDAWRRCYARVAESENRLREAIEEEIRYLSMARIPNVARIDALKKAMEPRQ